MENSRTTSAPLANQCTERYAERLGMGGSLSFIAWVVREHDTCATWKDERDGRFAVADGVPMCVA